MSEPLNLTTLAVHSDRTVLRVDHPNQPRTGCQILADFARHCREPIAGRQHLHDEVRCADRVRIATEEHTAVGAGGDTGLMVVDMKRETRA